MATLPSTQSVAVGNRTSAVWANSRVKSPLDFLLRKPVVRAFMLTDTVLTHNISTLVSLDAETIDTEGMHSTTANPSRVFAQYSGYHRITATSRMGAAVGVIHQGSTLSVRKNSGGSSTGGNTLITHFGGGQAVADRSDSEAVTFTVLLLEGEYIEFFVLQRNSTSSARTLEGGGITSLEVEWIAQA